MQILLPEFFYGWFLGDPEAQLNLHVSFPCKGHRAQILDIFEDFEDLQIIPVLFSELLKDRWVRIVLKIIQETVTRQPRCGRYKDVTCLKIH